MKNTITALLLVVGSSQAAVTVFDSATAGNTCGAESLLNASLYRVGTNGVGREMTTYVAFNINEVTSGNLLSTSTITFTLTPAAGVTPTDLTIDYVGTYASGTVDNTNIALWDGVVDTQIASITPASGAQSVDFDSSILDLSNDYVVVRFYDANVDRTSGTSSQWDISSLGASIPEPSSVALLGLGGLALVSRRRR